MSISAGLRSFFNAQNAAAPSPPPSPVPVDWENLVGCTTAGSGELTKTDTAGWGNGGAGNPTNTLAGDGYYSFTGVPVGTAAVISGLTSVSNPSTYTDIDFGVGPNSLGWYQVYESGNTVYTDMAAGVTSSSVIKIERVGGTINYYQDAVLKYTSAVDATGLNLKPGAAVYTTGAAMTSANVLV